MRIFKYVIEKIDDKYTYYEEYYDVTPETEAFFLQFKYDKVNAIDIPAENKQVFLFNNKSMLEAFKDGVYLEHNLEQRFKDYENQVVHADESEG